MFFSISIPVYNAEAYLDRCIRSILDQTENDYELILVDDGSTDNSLKICQAWRNEYPNIIKIIEKENEGSLFTRRRCLEESRGQYIYILDADDYLVDIHMLAFLKKIILHTGSDLIMFEYTKDSNFSPRRQEDALSNLEIFEGDARKQLYFELIKTSALNPLWNKVFHRELVDWEVNYNRFENVKVSTDIFQVIPIIFNAKKIVHTSQIFYYYRSTMGSIVHKFNPFIFESQKAHNKRLELYVNRAKMQGVDRLLATRLVECACTAVYKTRLIPRNQKNDKVKFIRKVGEDKAFIDAYYKADCKSMAIARRVIAWLLFHNKYKTLRLLVDVFSKLKNSNF